MKPQVLPNSFLRRMAPEARKSMGKAGMTSVEANAKYERGKEKELQRDIANLLRQRGLFFLQAPFGRKSGLPDGWPDFSVFCKKGNYEFFEAKAEGGNLSPEQFGFTERLKAYRGHGVWIIRNLDELKKILDQLV